MRRSCLALVLLAVPLPLLAGEKAVLVLNDGGHTKRMRGVFFTPDGKELISVAEDRTIRVWGVNDGEQRRVLRLPLVPGDPGLEIGLTATLSPDARTVAVAAVAPGVAEHWVYLVDLAGKEVTSVLKVGKGPVLGLAFSPDGKLLATSGDKHSVLVWDLETGKVRHELTGHTGDVRSLAFSPDGTRLASAGQDNTLRLWSVETGEAVGKSLEGRADDAGRLAWSPDGKTLANASGGRLRLWNPTDGTLRNEFKGQYEGNSLAFSGDSTRLLVGAALLDASTGAEKARFQEPEPREPGTVVALSPDGKTAAFGALDELFLWSADGGEGVKHELFRLGGHGFVVNDLAWSDDGLSLAWNRDAEGKGRTFNLAELAFGEPSDKTYLGARHSDDKIVLAAKFNEHEVAVQKDGKLQTMLSFAGDYVHCWTLLGDGQAVVGGMHTVRRYDTTTGQQLQRLIAGGVRTVAATKDGELFATGGIDQTIRVWTKKRDKPLLYLFVSGGEWIAWTPEGYYAASPGGERLMGWQIDNDPEQLASFHPAAQFRKSLYRPDVIARLVKLRDVKEALTAANKEAKRNDEIDDVDQVLPPKVNITTPDKAVLTVDKDVVDVKAVAESVGDYPVLSMQLLLDGRPYVGDKSLVAFAPAKGGKVEASWTARLTPGKHTLAVLAKSKPSNAKSPPVEVTYEAPKPVGGPDLYVLAVGIDDYPSPGLKLTIGVNDAEALAETFQQTGKGLFGEVKTKVLRDKEATRDGVREGLAWLAKNKQPRDLAVIFFSGHGCVGADGKLYVLAYDTDEDDVEKTGLGGEEVKKLVSGLPGRVLVLLCDCHAGAAPSTARPSHGELARDLADDDCGAIVICASLGSEKSLGSKERKHSYFTLALIEGLKGGPEDKPGEADYNKDGFISTTELFLYTQVRVNDLTFGRQTPTMTAPPVAPYALSKP